MDAIRATFERNARALELRPGLGRGTAVTHVTVRDGLACEVREGPWTFVTDMSPKSGGAGAGPNPGILGRAALGGCLAIGYVMWAAKRGVPITSLEVAVETDYDSRGLYGVAGVDPGYSAIRYIVDVRSPAPEPEIMRVLDEADAHSDFLHVFRHPQEVTREVRVTTEEYAHGSSASA
jgi:uncharacterized OsmC-like protein